MNTKQKAHYLETLPEPLLSEVYEFAKSLEKVKKPKGREPTWDDFIGILKDSPTFKGDAVKLQRKIRRECWYIFSFSPCGRRCCVAADEGNVNESKTSQFIKISNK